MQVSSEKPDVTDALRAMQRAVGTLMSKDGLKQKTKALFETGQRIVKLLADGR